jgi:hypothetical protein
MLYCLFKVLFILFFGMLIVYHFIYSGKRETMQNNKTGKEPIMTSINKNAGEIQQLKEEIDEIKDTFNSVKPLQGDVETNFKAINNLRNNAAARKAQNKMKE